MTSVSTLVIDAGPLIKKITLTDFSGNFITVPEVLAEIKDKATRDHLNVLPYTINVKTPSDEHLKSVQDFARKTGDFSSLSANDLKLIALVRQLSVEAKMHVRTEPTQTGSWILDERFEDVANLPGFYIPKSAARNRAHQESSTMTGDTVVGKVSEIGDVESRESESVDRESGGEFNAPSVPLSIQEGFEYNYDDEAGDDDEEGWITPETLGLAKINLESVVDGSENSVPVACMTFDFAIQNVLLQLGLNVLSPLKMLVKEARSYALRCCACFKISQNTEKRFCQNCGHKSLERVTVSTDADGNKAYTLLRRRPFSMKGTRFSLPQPQGGKYAHNPVLIDQQPMPQQRASAKARARIDALDIDYVAKQSPFTLRDTTSRAAQLGFNSAGHSKAYWERRNPNAVVRKKK